MKEILKINGQEYPMPENSLQEQHIFEAESVRNGLKPNRLRQTKNQAGLHNTIWHGKFWINGVAQLPKERRVK